MRIFSFDLILAMDFLNKIAEFMTTGLAEDPKVKEDVSSSKAVPDKSIDAIVVSKQFSTELSHLKLSLTDFQPKLEFTKLK